MWIGTSEIRCPPPSLLCSDEQLKDFPVDSDYLKPLQARVSLAKQIHTASFRRSKAKETERWVTRSAKALDIDLDQDDVLYP
jgi:hypothetical protein